MRGPCGTLPSGIPATHGSLTYVDLLGKPFELGGRGPNAYDCYGLAAEIRRRVGRPIPEDYTHGRDARSCHLEIARAAAVCFVELASPEPFCLVSFRIVAPFTSHIGVVLADRFRFIHIMRGCRVAVERLDSPSWHHRITGFWEIRNCQDGSFKHKRAGE